MSETPSRLIANTVFSSRLLLFLAATLASGYLPGLVLFGVIALLVLATWIVDIQLGRTLWLPARFVTYIVQAAYLAGIGAISFLYPSQPYGLVLLTPVFLIAFSSDAISNSRRWRVLVPWALITLCIYALIATLPGAAPEGWLLSIPYLVLVFTLLPAVATLARLFFTRTKNLIHTSLDYKLFRLEVLSFGMRKLEAIGLKRR